MRVVQYSLPGSEDAEAASLVVYHFEGSGGTVEQNIDRWAGQFESEDGEPGAGTLRLESVAAGRRARRARRWSWQTGTKTPALRRRRGTSQ